MKFSAAAEKLFKQLAQVPRSPKILQSFWDLPLEKDIAYLGLRNSLEQETLVLPKLKDVMQSSYFEGPAGFTSSDQWIMVLGPYRLASAILIISMMQSLNTQSGLNSEFKPLWTQCLGSIAAAEVLAQKEIKENALMVTAIGAGVIYGKLVLCHLFPSEWSAIVEYAKNKQLDFLEAQRVVINTTHYEIAAYLFYLWGAGDNISQALVHAGQLGEGGSPKDCSVLAHLGHLSAVFIEGMEVGFGENEKITALQSESLAQINLGTMQLKSVMLNIDQNIKRMDIFFNLFQWL